MKKYQYRFDNRELNYIIDGCIKIEESLDSNVFSSYFLIHADNYGFSAFSDDIEADEINFYFDIQHPLYLPFLHFLGMDKFIRINSDYCKEEYDDLKYIEISKKDDIICLKFMNKILEEHNNIEKFDFEIINTMYDIRSRLDHKDNTMKKRIFEFFNEVKNILTNEENIILDDKIYIK